MPQAVISAVRAGYFQLGHVTPFGIQTSIENFLSVSEAREFIARTGVKAKFSVGTSLFREVDIALIPEIARGLRFSDVATSASLSLARVCGIANRAEAARLVTVAKEGARKNWHALLTEDGHRFFCNDRGNA